jgi:trehalose/maltose hydrolase-like predicted phosphorylase
MGPDDFQQNVSNNAYTNVMASLAIHWARYMACECQRTEREEVPDDWIQRALYLYLPFDNVKRVHYQYEGYERGQCIAMKRKLITHDDVEAF